MTDQYVGKRVKRTEDPRLIRGLAHYVDDIALPNTLHVAFVRSIYAQAKITGIEFCSTRSSGRCRCLHRQGCCGKDRPSPVCRRFA